MHAFEPGGRGPAGSASAEPGGLLDLLGVAAVLLDARGRIVLWSPQAEVLFGWSAEEAVGRHAAGLLVAEDHRGLVLELFAKVMGGSGPWAGVFPVRRKDGSTRLVEFRNMRLGDEHDTRFALGIAADEITLRGAERDLALSARLVEQSPIGLAVLDTELRYVLVNPALAEINLLSAERHLGLTVREALPFLDAGPVEAAMRRVLESGEPVLRQLVTGSNPAGGDDESAWSVSYFRLEDSTGRVIGLATSVLDVTGQHRARLETSQARRRLAVIAQASLRIGTTLDLGQTARELADFVVPEVADIAAVDLLDSVVEGRPGPAAPTGDDPVVFRALAVASTEEGPAVRAADPPGEIAAYSADRLVTRCVTSARPVLVPRVERRDLPSIARSAEAAELLAAAGLRSYLAVPLVARGEVLGALDLKRTRNPAPFTDDDLALATELGARAAVCIDNARWYRMQRHAALALQRHLLPRQPPRTPGLRVASRYQPASAAAEVGGDWFDAIPLGGHRTALVVGDVMGNGINAAATMGQLHTTTRALAQLGLEPAEVLRQLDRLTAQLEETIATCVYALFDATTGRCSIALAGHLPPVLVHVGGTSELLRLPPGAPLGLGDTDFHAVDAELRPGDRLVLYTDGLVERRDQSLDDRLEQLLRLLSGPRIPLEATCDRLLESLRAPDGHDDVALLIAEAEP
ncbi:SpoIIE family protein phosphatase [Kitasatospora aburaviensis]|uniref:SpoIIE family protein phosphatase n=1 Tax=Kitasatospora aburaviensis TaxID=67265 RepID=A0ABW1FAI7_9ACTN